MLFMRAWSIITLLVVSGCSVRLPAPGQIGIAVKATTRIDARVQVQGQAQVQDAVVVPLQNAPVVEFFGVPLEGAQDVVFVLDCSGSMANAAQGRMAEIQPAPPPPADAPPADGAPPGAPPPPEAPPADAPPSPDAPPVAPAAPTYRTKLEVAQAELVDALRRLPDGTRMNVLFFNDELEIISPTMLVLDETGRTRLIEFVQLTNADGNTALAPALRTAFLMNPRRVVLLSDGLGNVGGNADAVLRDAREAMHGGVRIDAIGIGRGQDDRLLGRLAGESGGLYQAL
jgi:Mg-chelatase subunit ChlD